MSPLIVSDRIQCSNCHSPEHFSIRWDFASQKLSSVWLKETHHNSLQVRMSLLLTPWVRRVKIRNTDNTKSWWGYRTTGTRIHCWGEWKWFNHVGRQFCGLLIKLTTFLPHNLAIVLFSIYPPQTAKLYLHKTLHMDVYSSLLTTAKIGSSQDALR